MDSSKRIAIATVLLIGSCCFMIAAWYLHLKFERWSMLKAIGLSWLIAGCEYCLQVPANRIGHDAGLSPARLRAIAEVCIVTAFLVFQTIVLRKDLLMNHILGFAVVVIGVFLILFGPFNAVIL
ncbi:unnamed protein product, partial [Heterosigma akashiwo]